MRPIAWNVTRKTPNLKGSSCNWSHAKHLGLVRETRQTCNLKLSQTTSKSPIPLSTLTRSSQDTNTLSTFISTTNRPCATDAWRIIAVDSTGGRLKDWQTGQRLFLELTRLSTAADFWSTIYASFYVQIPVTDCPNLTMSKMVGLAPSLSSSRHLMQNRWTLRHSILSQMTTAMMKSTTPKNFK